MKEEGTYYKENALSTESRRRTVTPLLFYYFCHAPPLPIIIFPLPFHFLSSSCTLPPTNEGTVLVYELMISVIIPVARSCQFAYFSLLALCFSSIHLLCFDPTPPLVYPCVRLHLQPLAWGVTFYCCWVDQLDTTSTWHQWATLIA